MLQLLLSCGSLRLPQLAPCQQPRLHLCAYALELLLLLGTGPAPPTARAASSTSLGGRRWSVGKVDDMRAPLSRRWRRTIAYRCSYGMMAQVRSHAVALT